MKNEFTLFSFALRNLRRKPLRTGVLVVAIGLLVSVLVFALSFVRRVESGIKTASDRLGADLLIVPAGSRGAAEDVLLENRVKTFYMDKGIVERVRAIKGIRQATYQTYLVTITGECCDVPETVVVAFDQGSDFLIKPWLANKLGRKLRKGEAIVGSESALNISVGLTEVDGVLFGSKFRMVGVLDKTGTGLDTAIFMDEDNISDMLKNGRSDIRPGQISAVFAKVENGYDPGKVAGMIEDSIIEADAVARKDIGKSLISTLGDISRIFLITIVLASVLSMFLVWAVFSAIANERAKEVGIMRAVGAKEAHVVRLFLTEVLVIGGIGCAIGIISGTALSFLMGKSFAVMRNLSGDLSVVERVAISLVSFIVGTGICVAGALSPIQRIKRLEPLVAIKEE